MKTVWVVTLADGVIGVHTTRDAAMDEVVHLAHEKELDPVGLCEIAIPMRDGDYTRTKPRHKSLWKRGDGSHLVEERGMMG